MAGATRGRRPKLNRDLQARFLSLVRAGVPTEVACEGAGIASRTIRIWQERAKDEADPQHARHATFAAELEKAKAEAQASTLVDIRRHGKKDWKALAWLLERVYPERYGYKAQLAMTVDGELEKILDVAGEVLGPEHASKLLEAITSRFSSAEVPGQTAGPVRPDHPIH